MRRVHVLSPGFDTPNGRAFLFPLVVWRDALADGGIQLRVFRALSAAATACDVLIVDSKFHRARWSSETEAVLDEFRGFAAKCRVIYCDTTDSSGWLQPALLPIVHGYAKAQLLKDRAGYLHPMYAQRPFTDYYHREFKINDSQPEWSAPVTDRRHLSKLTLSWNSGLADYSLHGPLRMAIYGRLPLPGLLRFPRRFVPPSASRPRALSARFTVNYSRETVAYQRRELRKRLSHSVDTEKLSRRAYFRELETSKVVLSPFGLGEITLKDFEVFIAGSLLIKPDMTHMDTWPEFFRPDETMVTHAWDLSDLDSVLARVNDDYPRYRAVAEAGQETYRKHLATPQAAELFVEHFKKMLSVCAVA